MQVFGTDTVAVTGALIETLMLECPQCLEQYRRQNALFLGAYSITQFRMFCRAPVRSLAEVSGKKIRGTGGSIRWIQAMGGTPISLPPTDAVPAMQSGSVDCVLGVYSWLNSFGYMDLTKWIVDFPMGNPRGIAFFAVNRDTWRSFTPAQRKVMVEHMPLAVARTTIAAHIDEDEKALQQAKERGITIFKGGDDFTKRMDAYRDEERKAILNSMKELGVREPDQLMDKFLSLNATWEKLSEQMKNDVGKFADALRERVYRKIDPEKL
jgi:TRAP-type C4-dicarboxylate transport system substrate-binding protein